MAHAVRPLGEGRELADPEAVRARGFAGRASGPIDAIRFDPKCGTMWGGSSEHVENCGTA